MQRISKLKWILSAFMAVGLAGVPAFAAPKDKADDGEKTIRYAQLPDSVKKTVDEERGKYDVKEISHVKRDGNEFFRVTINTKGADKVIRVEPGGKLLDEKMVKDRGPEREAAPPSKASPRDVKANSGSPANFDNFPGKVKETTMREAKQYTKVVNASQYQHNNTEFYKTTVSDGNRERIIVVKGDGSLYSDVDDTDAGKGEVSFDKVPSKPRTAIGSEAGPNKIAHVYQISRDDKTYYRVFLDNGHEFVVDDDGKVGPARAATNSKRK